MSRERLLAKPAGIITTEEPIESWRPPAPISRLLDPDTQLGTLPPLMPIPGFGKMQGNLLFYSSWGLTRAQRAACLSFQPDGFVQLSYSSPCSISVKGAIVTAFPRCPDLRAQACWRLHERSQALRLQRASDDRIGMRAQEENPDPEASSLFILRPSIATASWPPPPDSHQSFSPCNFPNLSAKCKPNLRIQISPSQVNPGIPTASSILDHDRRCLKKLNPSLFAETSQSVYQPMPNPQVSDGDLCQSPAPRF